MKRIPTFSRGTGIPPQVKCSASELLGLHSLLRHFVQTRVDPQPGVEKELASFAAACRCIDLLLLAKRGVAASGEVAEALARASAEHLELHKAAYGTAHLRPKHHWVMDVPAQLRRDGLVLDSFIIERIHLQVKSIAEHIRNTSCYERSVLAGVLNLQAKRLSKALQQVGLEGRQVLWPGTQDVLVSDRMGYLGLKVARGCVAACVFACVCVYALPAASIRSLLERGTKVMQTCR